MPGGKQLNKWQVAQIEELKGTGLPQRKIAERVGCSQRAVNNVLRLGEEYNSKNHLRGRGKKLREKEVELARELAGDGKMSLREIQQSLATPVSYGTIYKAVNRANPKKCGEGGGPAGGEGRCFFCRSPCTPGNRENGKGHGVDANVVVVLKYVLETKSGKNDQLLQEIIQLLEAPVGNTLGGLGECDSCRGEARLIATLHRQLEKVQLEMVHQLKQFRGKILESFVMGAGERGGPEGEEKDQWSWKVLGDFQRAVHDKGKESVDVPCVILDRFVFTRNEREDASNGDDFEVTVKRETEEDEDDDPGGYHEGDDFLGGCDYEGAASDSEYHVSTKQRENVCSPRTVGRRKRKKRDNELDASWEPPTEECKLEEPQTKRRHRIASTLAGYLISSTSLPEEEAGTEALAKEAGSRPQKSQKRIKGPPKIKRSRSIVPRKKGSPRGPRIYKKMSCDLCPFSNRKSYIFEHHLRSHETDLSKDLQYPGPYPCDQCPQSFFCQQLHTFHQEGHQGFLHIACDSCNERIPYPDIESHVKTHTPKIFSCVNCSYCSTTREKYLAHLRHHGKGPMTCDLCSKPYRTRAKLLEHLYEVHQVGTKHVCDVATCRKEFLNLEHLKIHMYLHTNPHECPTCGKVYGDKTKLKVHQRSHTGEKGFQCPECHESFTGYQTLLRHRILVHGAEKFKCEYCDKEYMSAGMLRVHRTIHEGTGIPCGTCDKVLGSKLLWRRHQASHATEHSHICEECGKGFSYRWGLKLHSRIHGGEKKHKCQFCEKSFLYAKYLADHERTHTGERPFTCEICGKGFTQRGSVTLHMKKAHPDHRKESQEPRGSILGVAGAEDIKPPEMSGGEGSPGEEKGAEEGALQEM